MQNRTIQNETMQNKEMHSKLKQNKFLVILCMVMLLLSMPCTALAVVDAPASIYVGDYADVLSEETEQYIIAENQKLAEATGAQIVIVTVDFLDGMEIEDYAYTVFNQWGIGDAEKNNGLLLLLTIGEENYWAMQGEGLEGVLSSGTLGDYLYEYLEPDFAVGDYDAGVYKVFNAFLGWFSDYYDLSEQNGTAGSVSGGQHTGNQYTGNAYPGNAYSNDGYQENDSNFMWWIVILAAIVIILAISMHNRRKDQERKKNKKNKKNDKDDHWHNGPGGGGSYRDFDHDDDYTRKRTSGRDVIIVGNLLDDLFDDDFDNASGKGSRGGSDSLSDLFGGGSSRGGGAGRRSGGFGGSSGRSFGGGFRGGFGGGGSRGGGAGRR